MKRLFISKQNYFCEAFKEFGSATHKIKTLKENPFIPLIFRDFIIAWLMYLSMAKPHISYVLSHLMLSRN